MKELKPGEKTRRIMLTRGMYAIVDAADYDELAKFTWQAVTGHVTHYAQRSAYGPRNGPKPRSKTIKMHRQILGVTDRYRFVDHINGNGLDNRRANLRVVGLSENKFNQRKQKGASRFKGVYRSKDKWAASIQKNGEFRSLGSQLRRDDYARGAPRRGLRDIHTRISHSVSRGKRTRLKRHCKRAHRVE